MLKSACSRATIDHQIRARVSLDTGSIWLLSTRRLSPIETVRRTARPFTCHDLERYDLERPKKKKKKKKGKKEICEYAVYVLVYLT
jgi:hypothetical protein